MFSLFELVWKRIRLFFTDDEVFYIGGADVLPPPLEREQENRCLIALSGLHGDSEPMTREDARKQLIEHNLRLVVYLARKFENTGICVWWEMMTSPFMNLCGGSDLHRNNWADQGNQYI